ncbi:MAG: hypothetical protein HY301_10735 [Verrucomicrobia bacterium]|nr:hypothetical protein [Verrucomicrobiota bacterium]
MLFRLVRRLLLPAIFLPAALGLAAPLDYSAADPELKVVRLDSDVKESFLGLTLDSAGRLFVGGREAVFVYEPDAKGIYLPRQEIFRFPKDTWVSDIVVRGDDLYVLAASALYKLPGAVKARSGVKARLLLSGIGDPLGSVHHGLHGLALGPEGDLYVQHGDPFTAAPAHHWGRWTWSTADRTNIQFTGVGGVLRLKPDGSGLQIVSRGQRNSIGLAFDKDWNLFSNDNGGVNPSPDFASGRLLHVTAGTDFLWPRGWLPGQNTNRADVLETMSPKLDRSTLAGMAYYHDTFLPEKFRHNLLVAHGAALSRFPIEPNGATFKARELPLLAGGVDARPMRVAVGRGGRIFVTMMRDALPKDGSVPRSDLLMLTRADDKPDAPFEGYEETTAPEAKLFTELSAPDWTRRQRAHQELLRRGGKALKDATVFFAATKLGSPAMPHLVWLAAASETQTAANLVAVLFDEKGTALRLQAVRAAVEFRLGTPFFTLAALMRDDSPLVVHAALQGFHILPGRVPDEVIEGPGRSADTYLRQAAALLLAEKGTVPDLDALCLASNPARRLLGVLATGFRLTIPGATNAIPDTLQFSGGEPRLRNSGRMGSFTVADLWRVTKPGGEQEATFALLVRMLDDRDERVRFMAAHFLHLLNDPRSEERAAMILSAPASPAKQP